MQKKLIEEKAFEEKQPWTTPVLKEETPEAGALKPYASLEPNLTSPSGATS